MGFFDFFRKKRDELPAQNYADVTPVILLTTLNDDADDSDHASDAGGADASDGGGGGGDGGGSN